MARLAPCTATASAGVEYLGITAVADRGPGAENQEEAFPERLRPRRFGNRRDFREELEFALNTFEANKALKN
jgi:hypothetical protein